MHMSVDSYSQNIAIAAHNKYLQLIENKPWVGQDRKRAA